MEGGQWVKCPAHEPPPTPLSGALRSPLPGRRARAAPSLRKGGGYCEQRTSPYPLQLPSELWHLPRVPAGELCSYRRASSHVPSPDPREPAGSAQGPRGRSYGPASPLLAVAFRGAGWALCHPSAKALSGEALFGRGEQMLPHV